MRGSRPLVLVVALLGSVAAGLSAQKLNLAPAQKHLFILADEAPKLQARLDEAASVGFEVLLGSGQALLLKRTTESRARPTYRTIIGKFGSLERLLNAGADAGYVVLPSTLTSDGNDAMVTMGRLSQGTSTPTYRVLEWDGSFEKNLSTIGAKSLRPVGVIGQAAGLSRQMGRPGRLYVVIEIGAVEPGVSLATPATGWLRQVSAARTSKLEEELNETASGGYRVVGGSLMSVALQKVDASTTTYRYRVLGARPATLAGEIQQAARDGYRVVPGAIMENPGVRLETVAVMERASTPPRIYEYDFVITRSQEADLALFVLGEEGFVPVALLTNSAFPPDSTYRIIVERAQ